jgi:hypothetical protein
MRARRLEVEELFRVEVGEPARFPGLGEEAQRERGALRAVVPAAEGGDQDGALEFGTPLDAEVPGDTPSLRPRGTEVEAGGERDDPGPDRGGKHDVDEHDAPREAIAPLDLADAHLHEKEHEHDGR